MPERGYCANCGAEIRLGDAYCASCGESLAAGAGGPGVSDSGSWKRRGPGRWLAPLQGVARRFGSASRILKVAAGSLLTLLILVVPAARWAGVAVLVVSVAAIVVRGRQRRPILGWGVVAAASLVVAVLGGVLSSGPEADLREPLEGPVLSYCTEADEPRGCAYYEYLVTSPLEDPASGERYYLALVEVYWVPSLVGAEEQNGIRKTDITEEVGQEYGKYDAVMVAYLSEPLGDRPSGSPEDIEWVYNDPAARPAVERMAGDLGVPY